MKKYLFISAFLIVIINANAQLSCSMINSTVIQKALSANCGSIHDYSVYPIDTHTPIKYVRISFNIFQRTNGTGSFSASDAIIKSYFQEMIDSANYRLAHIQPIVCTPTCNPPITSPHVIDSRIRLVYNNTYIYKDDNLYNYTLLPDTLDRIVADSIYYNVIQQRPDLSTIDKLNTLHIIMVPGGLSCCGGQASGYGSKEWVHLRGYDYAFNYSGSEPAAIQGSIGHFLHEVCHSFGLWHNFQGGGYGNECTIIRDGIADAGCPTTGTSNNYMDYTIPRAALSEDQIAKMHYSLMGNEGCSIIDDVIEDFCQYNASQPTTITSGQNIVWGGSKNLVGDLIINGSLTVKCNVSVPYGGKIIVNSGGKLFVQGGKFTNACGDSVTVVEVLNGGYVNMYITPGNFAGEYIKDYNVKVKSGGTIRLDGLIVIQGNHSITVESGGYICIEPTAILILQHFNSVINLKCGYLNGVNPLVTGITSNCVASPGTFPKTGLGAINATSFLTDVYIQNTTLNGNQYITGNNIYIGSNVTTGTQGPVYIGSGANIILNACGDVIVPLDFDNPSTNSTLEIAPQ